MIRTAWTAFRGLSALAQLLAIASLIASLWGAWLIHKHGLINQGRERERAAVQRQNDAANARGDRVMSEIDACYESGREWDAVNSRCID